MISFNIGFLLLLLLSAAWHDIRSHRIPNVLVFPGAVVGVLSNAMLPQEMGGLGVLDSLAGLGVGLVLLLPLYLLRAMGAGDVKLMAMTGAFLGARGAISALLCVLLAGGVLALGVAWRQGKLRGLLYNLKMLLFIGAAGGSMRDLPVVGNHPDSAAESVGKLPYGVAIAAGTMVYLGLAHWG
ncbi:MAG: prepilin peptidase [Nitrosospira sp.]|nr:prepilin peptidase [Nitrosospira sp.]